MVGKGKGKQKSKFSILKFIWIIVGVILIMALIEGLSLLLKVKDYFP